MSALMFDGEKPTPPDMIPVPVQKHKPWSLQQWMLGVAVVIILALAVWSL